MSKKAKEKGHECLISKGESKTSSLKPTLFALSFKEQTYRKLKRKENGVSKKESDRRKWGWINPIKCIENLIIFIPTRRIGNSNIVWTSYWQFFFSFEKLLTDINYAWLCFLLLFNYLLRNVNKVVKHNF